MSSSTENDEAIIKSVDKMNIGNSTGEGFRDNANENILHQLKQVHHELSYYFTCVSCLN